MFCSSCGKKLDLDARFCPSCGRALNNFMLKKLEEERQNILREANDNSAKVTEKVVGNTVLEKNKESLTGNEKETEKETIKETIKETVTETEKENARKDASIIDDEIYFSYEDSDNFNCSIYKLNIPNKSCELVYSSSI